MTKSYVCRICKSERQEEINQLLKEKVPYREIARKYLAWFGCNLHLLEQSVASHEKHLPKELTDKEKELLERFGRGEVSMEEASRIVAKRVFEKLLKNPDDVRFVDYFRADLLRQKEEESQKQNSYAVELITRAFSGYLPPRNCPKCGYNIIPDSHLGDLRSSPRSFDQKVDENGDV